MSELNILGYKKIVYKYYKYLWVEFILLIFMNLYLEVGLQNKP
jgi:hypothetical protein